jgi:hypothetical protein
MFEKASLFLFKKINRFWEYMFLALMVAASFSDFFKPEKIQRTAGNSF